MKRRQHKAAERVGQIISVLLAIPYIAVGLLITPFYILYGLARYYIYLPICLSSYLRGGVQAAWHRCLPLWIQQGSIDDLRNKMVPTYSPSFPTILAREFASKFRREYKFVVSRMTKSKAEAECAMEMLVWQCGQMGEMPLSLTKQRILIPKRELPKGRSSMTLGEYMSLKARKWTTDVDGDYLELPVNSEEANRL